MIALLKAKTIKDLTLSPNTANRLEIFNNDLKFLVSRAGLRKLVRCHLFPVRSDKLRELQEELQIFGLKLNMPEQAIAEYFKA